MAQQRSPWETTPLADATLKALYLTHADYVTAMATAADAMRDAGLLLDIDYDDLMARAASAPVPRG